MSPGARQNLSALCFLLSVGGIFVLFVFRDFFAPGPVGLALQGLGVLLMIWARGTFGRRSFHFAANPTAGPLVTWGPYRFVRNPIYAAALWIVLVSLLTHRTWPALLGFAMVAVGMVGRALLEQAELERVYGDEYRAYAARTARLIPFVF